MTSYLWIGAVACVIVAGGIGLVARSPAHAAPRAVLTGEVPGPSPRRSTSDAAVVRTCAGQDVYLQADLKLDHARTHVLTSFEVRGRLGTHCRLRLPGIPVRLYVFDGNGAVRIRGLDPTPLVIKPQLGKPNTLENGTTSIVLKTPRKVWCATGGQRFELVVDARHAQPGTASAWLCGASSE